jgi:hypothetical protein
MDVSEGEMTVNLGYSKRDSGEDYRKEKRATELLQTNVNEYFHKVRKAIPKTTACSFGDYCACKTQVVLPPTANS